MNTTNMLYSAAIIQNCMVGDDVLPASIELYVLLVEAENEKEAAAKAEKVAKNKEHEYKNEFGDDVKWRFRKIFQIEEIMGDLSDTETEVFSKYITEKELESLSRPFADTRYER